MSEWDAKIETIHSNLRIFSERIATLYEGGICELAELAEAYAAEAAEHIASGGDVLEFLVMMAEELTLFKGELPRGVLVENKSSVAGFQAMLCELESVEFSRLFLEMLKKLGVSVSEQSLLGFNIAEETVTYVKNSLADEAYDVFSQSLTDPRVAYSSDFKEAATAVRNGKVGYAILPLEEGGDYRINGISSALFANDLKILAVTPVFGFDGNADLKYALVASSFNPMPYSGDDDRYLEILLPSCGEVGVSTVLSAAKALGAEPFRINFVSFDGDSGREYYYSLIFKRPGEDFSDLLTYLTVFAGEYIPMGIYSNLE